MNENIKIIFYNIFEGCNTKENFQDLINFINKEKPSIFAISEANNWEENNYEKLNLFLKKTNFRYHIFSKSNTKYNLALFSNLKKKKKKKKRTKKNIWHSVITAKIKDITYTILHLNPNGEKNRAKEMKTIFKNLNLKEKNVIMGDLNSLSSKDNYKEKILLEQLKQLKITKFSNNNKILYDVHNVIESKNLIDTHYIFNKNFNHTVPTNYNKDINHFSRLRLDYIYISNNLKNKITNYKILQNIETDKISDHYPILINMKK